MKVVNKLRYDTVRFDSIPHAESFILPNDEEQNVWMKLIYGIPSWTAVNLTDGRLKYFPDDYKVVPVHAVLTFTGREEDEE